MPRPAALLLATALAALPAAASAADEPAPAARAAERKGAPVVAQVRIEGNRRVEAEAVRAAMATKVGDELDRDKLGEDLHKVWRLGFFADVAILLDEADADRPVAVVRVVEKPAVREVKIRGNKELSDDDLKEIVDIKPFSILDMGEVKRNAKKVQDKYVEKGYFLAEVTHAVENLDNNEVNVFLDVKERAKVQVKRIAFVGNERVADSDLRESMQTEEGSFLSLLTSAGTYREEVLERDLAAVQGVYYDRGYIHAKVGHPSVSLSPDRRFVFISIPVTEGDSFTIGKIDFSGDILTSKEDLARRMSVARGEMFSRTRLSRDIIALNDVYNDLGFAYANITPQTDVDAEKRTVDLTFDIQKGQRVFIERIEIVGNSKTRDKVIRRELRIWEAELFTGTGMRLSRQRVMALGFFETVDLSHKKGSAEDKIVVTVTVKEKPTGTFQVGLGVSSVETFLLTAQVSQNNAFGWGQTASIAAQISGLRSLVQLSYVDPYFLDTPWILSFDYFRQELDYFDFLRRSNGGDASWGYHLTEDLMLHAGYAVEAVVVEPSRTTGTGILLANRFRDGLSSALRLTVNLDKRDNRLFPTAGHYQSVSVEHSPPWLGATFVYTRYTANTRWYYPVGWGFVLKAQGLAGYIAGQNIPISELFFAGGINTLRGYTLRSVSPVARIGTERSPDASLREFAIGGNKQAIFNFELEFPILDKAGFRGVLFYDLGNTYAEDEAFFRPKGMALPLGMLHSVGLGLRWFSPIGPLRFEWGFPLTRRARDIEPYVFEFTIGNFF